MVWSDEIEAYVEAHINDDVRLLALARNHISGEELRTALLQIELRQRTLSKLPRFASTPGTIFPSRLSSEQCSSEICARFKREIIHGHYKKGADLTGGLGIDTIALASTCDEMLYIEQNPDLCQAARHNMPLLAGNVQVVQMQAEEWLDSADSLDLIFLDPARRDNNGGKVFRIEDCSPDVRKLLPLLKSKARKVVVKLSPMLDIKECIEALHPDTISVVSVNNECKELIAVISDHPATGQTVIEAVELHADARVRMSFTLQEESGAQTVYASSYGKGDILAEPFAGFMKSGAWKTLCHRYDARMIAPSSHLYVTKGDFPGRCFVIEEVCPFSKKDASRILKGKANIAVRNFPMSVAEVRRQYKTQDGGDRYVFLTTDTSNRKLIIDCKKGQK